MNEHELRKWALEMASNVLSKRGAFLDQQELMEVAVVFMNAYLEMNNIRNMKYERS